MARYIDVDLLLTDEKTHTLPIGCGKASGNVVVFVDDIEKLPTADVAPRAEVAREIFARIEELIEMTAFADCWSEGGFRNDITELKKKYTEEK